MLGGKWVSWVKLDVGCMEAAVRLGRMPSRACASERVSERARKMCCGIVANVHTKHFGGLEGCIMTERSFLTGMCQCTIFII